MSFIINKKDKQFIYASIIGGSGGGSVDLSGKQNIITQSASSELAMLALTVSQYDIVKRTDQGNQLWQFIGSDPTLITDWVQINSNSATASIFNPEEVYVNLTNGSDGNAGTLDKPVLTLDYALSISSYSTTGAIIHITEGVINTPATITLNPGTKGLTLIGSSNGNHTQINDLIITSTSGKIILQDLSINNINTNINVDFFNCNITGTLTSDVNNQTIFIRNSDYNGLIWDLTRTTNNTGLIDIGVSSRGENIIQSDIHTLNTAVINSTTTDPSVLSNVSIGDRYLILGVPVGAWAGHQNEIAVALTASPTPTWSFEVVQLNSYTEDLASSSYKYRDDLGVFIDLGSTTLPWIINGKLADNIAEGLMSTGDRLKSYFVKSSYNFSDQNIDRARNSLGKGGNLIISPTEDYYNLDYFKYQVVGYNRFHISALDNVTPQGDEELKDMVIYLPHLRDINAINAETGLPMSEILTGYASTNEEMSRYFNHDTWTITNSSSNSLYTIIVKSKDPEAEFVTNVSNSNNIIKQSIEILQGSQVILEWDNRDKIFIQK